MRIYSIRDDVGEEFGPLFEQKSDETAMRAARNTFYRRVQSGEQPSKDYHLYYVGDFHSDTGVVEGFPLPKLIVGDLCPMPTKNVKSK